MKKINKRLRRLLGVTAAMLVVLLAATSIAASQITEAARERCFTELKAEAVAMGKEIVQNVSSSRHQLELVAAVAADYTDMTDPQLWEKLDSYISTGMLTRLEILLPTDEMITSGGDVIDVSGQISYADEAALGEHITGRLDDVTGSGGQIVRHYVPIKRGDETVALLCGVALLKDMPANLVGQPYNGEAAVYIIDRDTGDFLMDSWHDELGNIWDFGSRTMAPGYDNDQLKQGIADGESNYVVFVSKTIGSYLYFYYTPISINHWCVALSVPENLVLAQARTLGKTLKAFLAVEMLCLAVCFAAMVRYAWLEVGEKQDQVDLLNSLYKVERLLFNAHENTDRVSEALEQVCGMVKAEQVSYWMVTQPGYDVLYSWAKPGSAINTGGFSSQRSAAYSLMDYFSENTCDHYSGTAVLARTPGDGINDMLAVPIHDVHGVICGVLAAFNTDEGDGEANLSLLRGLEVSFGMFCRNMRTYQSVKEQSERDALTGLYNRNRYMLDAAGCTGWYKDTLACVYVDANGLHELNNSRGHAAGDHMLQTVGAVMTKYFGDEHTYRIGGDEFLAFVADKPEDELQLLADKCIADVRDAGYHIAVGIEAAENVSTTEPIVEAAEKKMYAAKHAYYAARGVRRSAR